MTDIIIALLTFSTFLFFYLIVRKRASQDDITDRVKSATKVGKMGSASSSVAKGTLSELYEAGVSEIFDAATGFQRSEYKVLFEQAGWDAKNAQRNALITKIGLVIALVAPVLFLLNSVQRFANQPPLIKLLLILGAAISGLLLFNKFMQFVINRRYDRISKDLHSAVELLVVCSKAGMGIEKGMERVAQEVAQYNPDLGRELLLTAIELEVVPNRKVAYENLRRRVNLPLVYGMTTTLIQAEEQGSSISESLRMMSDEFRTQLLMDFEKKAAKLPATLSIPVVLFTLPTLMAVIAGPAVIKLLRDTNLF